MTPQPSPQCPALDLFAELMRALARPLLLPFILIACMSIGGCAGAQGSNDLFLLETELARVGEERDMLQQKVEGMWDDFNSEREQWLNDNYELKTELAGLRDIEREKSMLQSRYDGLQDRHERLGRWARALVRGYGPGIWIYNDEHFQPLYARRPAAATVDGILGELNDELGQGEKPLLVLEKFESGEVHLGLGDTPLPSGYMGMTGGMALVQTVSYSLASLNAVRCVQLNFLVGEYDTPQRYCE